MLGKQSMQIRLLKVAEEDFTEIISFIAAENPKAAETTATKIEKNLELLLVNPLLVNPLLVNPLLGRVPRDEDIKILGYRYLIVSNYIIFYTIEEKTIYIHRILHSAQNYKAIL